MPRPLGSLVLRYLLLALAVLLLNFLLPRFLPGDPLDVSSGEGFDPALPLSGPARAQLRAYYQLDRPLSGQLAAYLAGLARGDLGWSISRAAPVGALILARLPWTLALLLTGLAVSFAVGVGLGLAAGWAAGTARDRLLSTAASLLAAIPEFLLAIGLLMVFSVGLGWFPLFGGRSVLAPRAAGMPGLLRAGLDVGRHLALPVAALALAGLSGVVLLTRDSTARLAREPWLALARAKGLPERQIARRHVLPNLALPLLTFAGLRLGTILGGALVVERVFGLPGLGLLGYQAVQARDYPVLQALFLLSSLGVLAANFLVEVVYLQLARRAGSGVG